jgi:hypothetical protein
MPHPLPSYRHHRPSRQAVVTLNGRDFYLGPWKSPESRAEYDRLIAEWVSNGRQLPHIVHCGELSVAELLVAYLNFAREYYSSEGAPTGEYTGMKDAMRPLRDLYAGRSNSPHLQMGCRERTCAAKCAPRIASRRSFEERPHTRAGNRAGAAGAQRTRRCRSAACVPPSCRHDKSPTAGRHAARRSRRHATVRR